MVQQRIDALEVPSLYSYSLAISNTAVTNGNNTVAGYFINNVGDYNNFTLTLSTNPQCFITLYQAVFGTGAYIPADALAIVLKPTFDIVLGNGGDFNGILNLKGTTNFLLPANSSYRLGGLGTIATTIFSNLEGAASNGPVQELVTDTGNTPNLNQIAIWANSSNCSIQLDFYNGGAVLGSYSTIITGFGTGLTLVSVCSSIGSIPSGLLNTATGLILSNPFSNSVPIYWNTSANGTVVKVPLNSSTTNVIPAGSIQKFGNVSNNLVQSTLPFVTSQNAQGSPGSSTVAFSATTNYAPIGLAGQPISMGSNTLLDATSVSRERGVDGKWVQTVGPVEVQNGFYTVDVPTAMTGLTIGSRVYLVDYYNGGVIEHRIVSDAYVLNSLTIPFTETIKYQGRVYLAWETNRQQGYLSNNRFYGQGIGLSMPVCYDSLTDSYRYVPKANVFKPVNVTITPGTPQAIWTPMKGFKYNLLGFSLSVSTSGQIFFKDGPWSVYKIVNGTTPISLLNTMGVVPGSLEGKIMTFSSSFPATAYASQNFLVANCFMGVEGYLYMTPSTAPTTYVGYPNLNTTWTTAYTATGWGAGPAYMIQYTSANALSPTIMGQSDLGGGLLGAFQGSTLYLDASVACQIQGTVWGIEE